MLFYRIHPLSSFPTRCDGHLDIFPRVSWKTVSPNEATWKHEYKQHEPQRSQSLQCPKPQWSVALVASCPAAGWCEWPSTGTTFHKPIWKGHSQRDEPIGKAQLMSLKAVAVTCLRPSWSWSRCLPDPQFDLWWHIHSQLSLWGSTKLSGGPKSSGP